MLYISDIISQWFGG